MSEKLSLTMALSDYDHTRDLTSGRVTAEGISLTALDFQVEEIFYRSLKFREFDVCELSFGKYISLLSQGDETFSAIPVFPSRVFDGVSTARMVSGVRNRLLRMAASQLAMSARLLQIAPSPTSRCFS